MANVVGTPALLTVTPVGGALADPSNLVVTTSDTAVVTVTALADPSQFRLDFLSEGSFTLASSATASDGSTVNGTITDSVVNPVVPATSLEMVIGPLPA